MDIPDRIRAELSAGEQILWAGQPIRGLALRGSDAVMIPASLLIAGVSVLMFYRVLASNDPLGLALTLAPLALLALYLVIGRFFIEAKQRAATFYAFTSKRIIICAGVYSKSSKSLPLKTLAELTLVERADGYGTISFGAQHPMAASVGGSPGWPVGDHLLGPRFDLVPNARAVYESIRSAQERAT